MKINMPVVCIRDLDKLNLIWWLEPIFDTAHVASKNITCFKNVQKRHSNNHLVSFSKVNPKSQIHTVYFLHFFQRYDVAKGLVDNWIPRCYRQSTPCTSMLQFVRCLPYTFYEAEGKQLDDTSLSEYEFVSFTFLRSIFCLPDLC